MFLFKESLWLWDHISSREMCLGQIEAVGELGGHHYLEAWTQDTGKAALDISIPDLGL